MGPCRPEDRNRPTDSQQITASLSEGGETEQQPTDATDDTAAAELVDPLQAQQEAWVAAEGYTPLADLAGGGDGTYLMMMSAGPANDDDNGGGAFFMNPSAFGVANDIDEDEANQCQQAQSSENGFEDAAARALLALDEEYQSCVRPDAADATEEAQKSSTEDVQDNTNSPEDNEDIKIIAAAFDKRKEEMQQMEKQGGFPVNWDGMIQPRKKSQETKKNFDVDTVAVKKAVEALSVKNKDAKFQQKFEAWQQKQKGKKAENIPKHSLIPAASMKAFYRSTPKAKQATANLTRSATIAEALIRIILSPESPSLSGKNADSTLLVDIVGVDHEECSSVQKIETTFRPIVRWLASYNGLSYSKVHFRLVGRDLMESQCHSVDLLSSVENDVGASSVLKEAVATCHIGVYHEFLEGLAKNESSSGRVSPDLAVAFNAGIWGYEEWATTILYLAKPRQSTIPFVITAYTLSECREDCTVVVDAVDNEEGTYKASQLWEPELNQFGSLIVRETKSSSDEYRENSSWQAWLLGGTGSESI